MRRRLLWLVALLACAEAATGPSTWVEEGSPATRDGLLHESVGIEVGGGEVTAILRAPCPLPCEERVSFGTAEDDQREILIYVFRGNARTTLESHALGAYEIAGLPAARAGSIEVFVTFRAAPQGISLHADPIPGVSFELRPATPEF
ncbi:MAG: Hsp70 family protein [Myxococcota bacterium]